MNLDEKNINQLKEDLTKNLNNSEDKGQAIMDALEKFTEVKYASIIEELRMQSIKAESDKEYAKKLGLRTLSKEEETFYEKLKKINQAVTADQIDTIPTSMIDLSLADIRESNGLLSHVNFAPADVKRWFTASHSGSYSWTELTKALEKGKDITATFKTLITELGKLYLLIIVPKSIRDLSYQFIDKYFMAVFEEQEEAGLIYGFLNGDGKEQPIGIYKQIDSVEEESQKHKDKELGEDITKFSPKGLAPAKKALTNGGKRSLNKLILICNPEDRADYVDPALYDDEGKLISSYKNLEVFDTPENVKGKAALYLDKTYTMGYSGMNIKSYDQTLALEDADVLIGTGYANGRAIDDKCAYIFDVTKLEEYVQRVTIVGQVETNAVPGA